MADSDASYTTTAQVKEELGITVSTYDSLLTTLITQASRRIDALCRRRFYTPTADETRTFDLPDCDTLTFDMDLYSLTSITNGNSVAIASTAYVLLPANKTPKYGLRLKATRGVVWTVNSYGDTEQVVSVAGKWGYSDAAPDAVKRVCANIVKYWFSHRTEDGTLRSKTIGDYSVTFGGPSAGSMGNLPDGVFDDLSAGGFIREVFA